MDWCGRFCHYLKNVSCPIGSTATGLCLYLIAWLVLFATWKALVTIPRLCGYACQGGYILLSTWTTLTRRQKVILFLSLIMLGWHCHPTLKKTCRARDKFSIKIKYFRAKHKTKWRTIKRTSRACRRCNAKRGHSHYDQAGGVDGSYLLRPATKEKPYLSRAEMDAIIVEARGKETAQRLS